MKKHWGNLDTGIRRYLLLLMDSFDVTYDTKTQGEIGLVVPKLPASGADPSCPEWEEAKDKPEATIIYKFTETYRHLPPGIPTWTIARAHRYRASARPFLDLAFFAYRDNTYARLQADPRNRSVELKVRADYPPRFLGVMQEIFNDTIARYPGLQPQVRVPCLCQDACKQTFSLSMLEDRHRKGKQDVVCDSSGEDVSIDLLLSGVRGTNARESEAAADARHEEAMAKLSDIARGANYGARASAYTPACPRIFKFERPEFSLLPRDIELKQRLQLSLYCEAEGCTHVTEDSVYQFDVDQDFLNLAKTKWNTICDWAERIRPVVTALSVTLNPLSADLAKAPQPQKSPTDPARHFVTLLNELEREGFEGNRSDVLKDLLTHLDSKRGPYQRFGGFELHSIENGEKRWLCPRHLEEAKTFLRTSF